jgi:hypothetical protein
LVTPLHTIYGFVLILKMGCNLCVAGSPFLNFSSTDFKIDGGLSSRSPGFELRLVLCEISGDQSGNEPSFSYTNSTFPGHYHFVNAHTYLHLRVHDRLTRRTSEQTLRTSKNQCPPPQLWGTDCEVHAFQASPWLERFVARFLSQGLQFDHG